MRLLFCDPHVRAKMPNWENDARFAVAAFRLDLTRVGATARAAEVVDALCEDSAEFRGMWADNGVGSYGEGIKHIVHPIAGPLVLEYSAFAVDGQPDCGLVIYTPTAPAEVERVRMLLADGRDGWGRTPIKRVMS